MRIPRLPRWFAGLLLALALPAAIAATPAPPQDFELPPVDEVFVLSAQATSRDRIEVRWKIAEGYYLYRHRTAVSADAGFGGASLSLPKGKAYRDEFFGDVETYRTALTGVLTGTAGDAASTTLTVKYQGCADAGICYPPQSRTLKVMFPQALDASDGGFGLGRKGAGGLFGLGGTPGGAVDKAPLPVEKAFRTEVIADGGNTLLLRLTPAKGYYLYRDKLAVQLEAGKGLAVALPPAAALPKATPYHDEHFGDVAVYFDQVEIALPVTRTRTAAAKGNLVLELQGCQDGGICYPPMTRTLAVSLPAGTLTPATPVAPAATATVPAAATPVGGAGTTDTPDAGVAAAPGPIATPLESTPGPAAPNADVARTPPPQQREYGLLMSLLFAVLGGLILNLMPCVLPVLSLKALSLAQSGESRESARRHALAYTAGVLLSFAALGALALALRKAGLALGWGFQLQQPLVVAALALVIFALGLSLSGLWYANLGVGARSNALLQKQGVSGDFFTGVLAVVVASPCTAPFMGVALAYAFTAPTPLALLVFAVLGLGLALPFLLIGFVPALASRLPRPGAWMDTLKQVLAFPMYLTAVWLLWVLGKQRGIDAVGLALVGLVLLALGLWWYQRARFAPAPWQRALALALAVSALVPLAMLHRLPAETAAAPTTEGHAAYSAERLAALRAEGRIVFVDMTADWCVTCKANEKAVLNTPAFRELLATHDAVMLTGDWTNVDPAITAFLEAHGAVGVPLYVLYPRGGGAGEVLPTVLTQDGMRRAFERAAR